MPVSPALDINTGVALTFTTCPILAAMPILDCTLPGAEIETFDSSDQGIITGARTKIPADVHEISPFEYVVQHKQDVAVNGEIGTSGAVEIALPSGGVGKLAFTGIFKSYKPQNTPYNEPMYADVVIEVSGDITVTASAA